MSLPTRPDDLICRQGPRDQILDALRRERAVVVVCGMGGAGKTWLALDIAHQLRADGFFPEVVWLSARDRPPSLDDLVRTLFRSLRSPERAVAPLDELVGQVDELLDGRPVLLVLDNFETVREGDRWDLLHFLGWVPAPSRVLITSRQRNFPESLLGESSPLRVIEIGGLTESESRQLTLDEAQRGGVLELLGAPERILAALHETTSGLPFALRWLVAEARVRSLTALLENLESGSLEVLRFLFEQSWVSLGLPSRRALQTLSLLGAPASESALAVAAGVKREDLGAVLCELRERLLVENRTMTPMGEALLGLHPLVRSYVLGTLHEPSERRDAITRVLGYYARLVKQNGEFLDEAGHDRLEAEHEVILSLAEWCYEYEAWSWVIALVRPLNNFFWMRGYWRERVHFGQMAQHAASRLGDARTEGDILSGDLAWTHIQLGELHEAWTCLDQAKELLELAHHYGELSSTWRYLAQISKRGGDLVRCRELLGLALETAKRLADPFLADYAEARARVDLGFLCLDERDLDEAEHQFQQATDYFHSAGDHIRWSYAQNGLGDLAMARCDHTAAARYYERSIEVAESCKSAADRARALLRLARLDARTGRLESSLQRASEARDIFRRVALRAEVREAEELLESVAAAPEPLRIDTESHRVWVNGDEVHLRPQAVELLAILKQKSPALCGHAELIKLLWPGGQQLTPTLRKWLQVVIFNIRRAIEVDPSHPTCLINVHGEGYRLDLTRLRHRRQIGPLPTIAPNDMTEATSSRG